MVKLTVALPAGSPPKFICTLVALPKSAFALTSSSTMSASLRDNVVSDGNDAEPVIVKC